MATKAKKKDMRHHASYYDIVDEKGVRCISMSVGWDVEVHVTKMKKPSDKKVKP